MSKFKVSLALGGGGARGLAHLGVLKVLEEAGISFDLMAGTSFGAIVGAMYAQIPDAANLQKRVTSFLNGPKFKRAKIFFIKKHYEEEKRVGFIWNLKTYLKRGIFFGISLQKTSFISERDFLENIHGLFEDKNIEETAIPFIVVATDLVQGNEVVLDKGSIRQVVAASCAIPGVFPPITVGSLKLIDGGWVNQVPVDPLISRGSDFIIAVDTSEEPQTVQSLGNGLDIVLRAGEITRKSLSELQMKRADVILRPRIGHIHWSDFWRMEEAVKEGEAATRERIDEIKKAIWKKKMKKLLLMNTS
ncbi:MAG TPA: patatin-like phospholipase family protein [Nitrospiria bacterium]|nr:patatin-like phospholipase family protein [Nitrospiria bacterium]